MTREDVAKLIRMNFVLYGMSSKMSLWKCTAGI